MIEVAKVTKKLGVLNGFAKVMDIGLSLRAIELPEDVMCSDIRSIYQDWWMIGLDIKSAIERLNNERQDKSLEKTA